MPPRTLTGVSPFAIDDDALFPLPVQFSTWEGCVAVWNRCVDFSGERTRYLGSIIERAAGGGMLQPEDADFLDLSLDALAGRMALVDEVQARAFDAACQGRYGFGTGDVIEIFAGAEGVRLGEVTGGGLPRAGHPPTVRFSFNMVEPFQGGWLSARVGLPFLEDTPDKLAHRIRIRPDIKVIKATESPAHWLPLELCGADFLSGLRQRINPRGFNVDRMSTLLAFWEESLWQQQPRPWSFNAGDIVAVKKPSRQLFHVVFHGATDDTEMTCYDPRKATPGAFSIGSLSHVSISRGTRVSCALPISAYYAAERHPPPAVAIAFALRETARAAKTGGRKAPRASP